MGVFPGPTTERSLHSAVEEVLQNTSLLRQASILDKTLRWSLFHTHTHTHTHRLTVREPCISHATRHSYDAKMHAIFRGCPKHRMSNGGFIIDCDVSVTPPQKVNMEPLYFSCHTRRRRNYFRFRPPQYVIFLFIEKQHKNMAQKADNTPSQHTCNGPIMVLYWLRYWTNVGAYIGPLSKV